MGWTDRTELLLGSDAVRRLASSHVVVVGVGGVGAYAAEMLARSGVGHITLIDSDTISESNVNRQLIALHSTVGLDKVGVLSERLRDINPDITVDTVKDYLCEDNARSLIDAGADYVVDAIDTLSPKVALIQFCLAENIPLVSAMGAGAKTDITSVRIADISKTVCCPLAHQIRKRLHRLGITTGFLAVFSTEKPDREAFTIEESRNKKSQVGTISYMPAVFGCACAQAVVCRIAGLK